MSAVTGNVSISLICRITELDNLNFIVHSCMCICSYKKSEIRKKKKHLSFKISFLKNIMSILSTCGILTSKEKLKY